MIETIIEITEKLIGDIEPHGETHVDVKNLEHIKQYRDVAVHMIQRLNEVSWRYENAHQCSIQQIKSVADNFMKDVKTEYFNS